MAFVLSDPTSTLTSPATQLSIETALVDGSTVIRLEGDLTGGVVAEASEILADMVRSAWPTDVSVDLGRLSAVDAGGIQLLVEMVQATTGMGSRVIITDDAGWSTASSPSLQAQSSLPGLEQTA